MKKDKLYTANRWNQSAFMPEGNLFEDGGPTNPFGVNLTAPAISPYNSWMSPLQKAQAQYQIQNPNTVAATQQLGNFAPKENAVANPFNFREAFSKDALKNGLKAGAGSAIGGVASVVGGLAGNAIAGGLESGAGNAIGSIGGTIGSAVSAVNPLLGGAISVGSKLVGGLTNRAFGIAVDKGKLDAANAGTAALNSFNSNATSFDGVTGPQAQAAVQDAYRGGWFTSGKAQRKNDALRQQRLLAEQWANRSVDNNIQNISQDQMGSSLRNYAAFGGPIESGMGAVDYDFMKDYLLNKKQEIAAKNKIAGLAQIPAFMPNSFAIGGDLQMNGADWTNGTMHIDAGGSHESNPYEGIQIGKDASGTPNLVEEGERIFNDYVYSKRIFADGGTLEKFHLSKKRKISFADLAELLEKESKEHPNDPISQAGLKAQMSQLAEEQERQKAEMEAERAKAAFEALSPEEQTALMQQRAEQEAMAQQAAMQEAAAMQSTEQPTLEEATMAQQQQVTADGSEPNLGQIGETHYIDDGAVAMANGGRIVRAGDVEPNKFAIGGRKAKRIAKKYNEDWFRQMAKSLGISDKEMEDFKFTNDPEANLTAFNNIYRNNQYEKAKKIYTEGQRQSKRNELFGDKGLYSYSDDKSKIYKARTNNSDRIGWISKDYTGAVDSDGNMLGFLSQEDYDKLKPEEKEAYRRINEKAGDRMYDYNGRVIRDLYNGTEEKLLNSFDADYDKGFKWDDKDAQTLQYPVDMEHSAKSAMRYIPAIGGAIGLGYDLLSSPDYSRPQAIIDAARSTSIPEQIQPHYVGNYLTYRPMDIWYQQNALNAQSRATDRQLVNNSGGNRGTAMAGLLANGYNSQIASGNLYRQALEYNDALRQKVEDFNRGTNIFNANADMDTQKTNAMLRQQAGRLGLQGLMTGYGMMDDIDARRQASMNANLTNVLQSLGNIGEEAYDEDRLRWLEKTGTLKSRTLSANGGKLKKKKRGLTI